MPETEDPQNQKARIAVIFYSMTGNVLQLAEAAAEGVQRVKNVKADIRRVPELIPMDIIESKSHLKSVYERKQGYEEAQPTDLRDYDGFLFASPTRYGNMAAQMREFFDRTGGMWQEGASIGKFAGIITSTSTMHGGQEVTAMTTWPTLIHLGMMPVGVPYSEQRLFEMVPEGGSPYAASSVSGPNADQGPTERELAIARTLGERVAQLTRANLLGCRLLEFEEKGHIPHAEAFVMEGAATRGS